MGILISTKTESLSISNWSNVLDNCLVDSRHDWVYFYFFDGWLDSWKIDWQVHRQTLDWLAITLSGSVHVYILRLLIQRCVSMHMCVYEVICAYLVQLLLVCLSACWLLDLFNFHINYFLNFLNTASLWVEERRGGWVISMSIDSKCVYVCI